MSDPRDELARLTALCEAAVNEPHVINLTVDGWTLRHPLSCRIGGSLFDCPVNIAAHVQAEDLAYDEDAGEYRTGRFVVSLRDDVLHLGEPMPDADDDRIAWSLRTALPAALACLTELLGAPATARSACSCRTRSSLRLLTSAP